MMLSILTQESRALEVQISEPAEFEIVLGRRQVSSLLFFATVVVVVFSALSYLAGKTLSPKNVAAASPPVIVVPPPAPVIQPAMVTAPEVPKPAPAVAPEPPLFAEPAIGAVYIQIKELRDRLAKLEQTVRQMSQAQVAASRTTPRSSAGGTPTLPVNPLPPTAAAGSTGSNCAPAIESAISGEFNGWDGETIFKLDNGQIWQQAEYDYTYSYSYRPEVTIYQTSSGCRMKVEDEEETILVKRLK